MSPDIPAWQAAHDAAVDAEFDGYIDPSSGLFVMTRTFLLDRGTCCGSNCRHCPYPAADQAGDA